MMHYLLKLLNALPIDRYRKPGKGWLFVLT